VRGYPTVRRYWTERKAPHARPWASPCGVEGSVRNLSTPGGWNGTETSPEAVHPRV
jgi:hypothetical protein